MPSDDLSNKNSGLLGVNEVSKLLDIKKSRAYKVIRDLNAMLKKQGKYTISGKISKKFLLENLGI